MPALTRLLPLAGGLLVLFGCRTPIRFDEPIPIDDTFERVEATGAAAERYARAAAYSAEHRGLAFMVLEGETVVWEDYTNGDDGETPHHIWSGTKSFGCFIAGLAVDQGRMAFDEEVSAELTEFRSNDRKSRIRVQHLLHFTSGLAEDKRALTTDGLYEEQRIDDKYEYSLTIPSLNNPGTKFRYGSTHLMVFGEFFKRRMGRDPLDFLEEGLLDPVGFRYAGWHHDPAGNALLPYGAWTTANEWAKIGVVARDRGAWDGVALLSPETFDACLQGSAVNPAYGLNFWMNKDVPGDTDLSAFRSLEDGIGGPIIYGDGPSDLFMAAGFNDNRLYILPSQDLVVVRLATRDVDFTDAELLRRLLP